MQDLRTTTGQKVSISYDVKTNTITFREGDWFADPLRSTGVPARLVASRPQASARILRLRPRRGRRVADAA